MKQEILNVEGMSCEHCARAVTNAVKELTGVINTNVNLADKKVVITIDESKAEMAKIIEAIEEEGYSVKQ